MHSLKDRKVLIFGLGLNDGGLGMAEYFLKHGALVTITDLRTKEQLSPILGKLEKYKEQITLHLGEHREEDFLNNDIIVRNPAVKPNSEYLQIAQKAGKQIEMEMSLFHRLSPCPIIGITGTRGKSTTTSLIYEFLKKKYGGKIFLGGNIGRSAIREVDTLTKDNIAVLEISSFHLDGMGANKVSPHIAVVTNMYIDHQDWHGSMEEYINAKKNIYRYQGNDDYLVVNIDNDITKEFVKDCKSNIITYSLKDTPANYYMDDNMQIYLNGVPILKLQSKDVALKGEHNMYNILSAIATAKIYDISNEDIEEVLKDFKGVPGRQELVRELNGVKFYNDTTATSVEAVKAMFERFSKDFSGKIIMIAGGVDKGLDYSLLVDNMKEHLKGLVLLEGTASERINDLMGDFDNTHKYFNNMESAVKKAYELAKDGDMVILCPSASSFNMFLNEFDRGDQYVKYVNLLK
jgi:UDP-N-acetylmuramoylalanine--D-glutamate ligase